MSALERVVRGFGAVGWVVVAARVATDMPDAVFGIMGAFGCGFVGLLLAVGAITGRSPIQSGDE